MKIITLTLNPAFDIHARTEDFRLGRESFFEVLTKDAGGKGVNISRALNEVKVENTAIVVVGKENGDEYLKQLDKSKVKYIPLPVEGRIRENIILHDNSAVETRVSFNGFKVSEELFNKVVEAIGEPDGETVVTLTGSNPKGVDISAVKKFAQKLKEKGAKVVIDSRSFSLSDILEVKPFLIKPNEQEISEYMGRDIKTLDEMSLVAAELQKKGVENVMISCGGKGGVLASDEGVFTAIPPKIDPVSTIGAGDSMVAGFIYAYISGKQKKDCLIEAISFGTAACLQKGTLPPEKEDIERVKNLIIS